MTMKKQDITNSKTWQKYVKKKNITQTTLGNYTFSLLQFCKANNKPLDNIVEEVLEEQLPYIDEQGRIHEYNPEYSLIDNYINNTITYLQGKGNSEHSIHAHMMGIRSVLTSLGVKLPAKVELERNSKEWYVLSKDDIRFVLSISALHHQALITFLAHTGIRIGDVRNLRISDFMKATYKYHECTEIDDFLEKAPEDMIGYWQFKPQKTIKHDIECKVYNTEESSNLILRSLHRRRNSIEALNLKKGTDYKLEKNDYLFSSRNKNFKGQINESTVTTLFIRRNKDLRKHKERLLCQEYNDGRISEETLEQKLSEIPVFHAHGLRKFFITTLARKRVDLRASAFLEGHTPFMQHDRSYVDSDNLEELIFEEYQRVIPALSFVKDEEDFELGKMNHDLQIENAQLKQQKEQLEKEKQNMKEDFKREAKQLLDELLRENNITL